MEYNNRLKKYYSFGYNWCKNENRTIKCYWSWDLGFASQDYEVYLVDTRTSISMHHSNTLSLSLHGRITVWISAPMYPSHY